MLLETYHSFLRRSRPWLLLPMLFIAFFTMQCQSGEESSSEEMTPPPAPEIVEEVDVVPVPVVLVVKERPELKERHKARAAVVEKQPETYAKVEHKDFVKAPARESKKEIIFVPHRTTYVPVLPEIHPQFKEVEEMSPARKLTEFDTPPMYDPEDCLSKKHPKHCAHMRLQSYFSKNINMSIAPEDSEDHVEFATFIIKKDGTVDPTMIEVIDQTPHCEPCAEEAKRLVREMDGTWMPAIWKGEAVDARVTLPIRFHNFEI